MRNLPFLIFLIYVSATAEPNGQKRFYSSGLIFSSELSFAQKRESSLKYRKNTNRIDIERDLKGKGKMPSIQKNKASAKGGNNPSKKKRLKTRIKKLLNSESQKSGRPLSKKKKVRNKDSSLIEIKGEFQVKSHRVHFALEKREDEYYLILSVAGGSCDYLIRTISTPHPLRGRKGIILSDKNLDCDFGISESKINRLFNSFSLADLTYTINKAGKIKGDMQLQSLTASYKTKIY